jgi:hypothetical protein
VPSMRVPILLIRARIGNRDRKIGRAATRGPQATEVEVYADELILTVSKRVVQTN